MDFKKLTSDRVHWNTKCTELLRLSNMEALLNIADNFETYITEYPDIRIEQWLSNEHLNLDFLDSTVDYFYEEPWDTFRRWQTSLKEIKE